MIKHHIKLVVVCSLTLLFYCGVFSYADAQTDPLFGTESGTSTSNWNAEITTATRKIGWTWKSQGTGYICGFNTIITHDFTGTPDPNESLIMNMWSHGSTRDKPENNVLVASASFGNDTLIEKDNPLDTDNQNFMFDNCVLVTQDKWYSIHFEGTITGIGSGRLYWSRQRATGDANCVDCWFDRHLPVSGGWQVQDDNLDWIWYALGFSEGLSIFDEPTSDAYGFDPDQDFGFFGNMLRDIGKFLFVPSEDALNQWENTKDRLFARIPFSYIEEIQDTISDLSIASSSFPSITYDLTPYGLNASGSLFGIDTVSEYLPEKDIGYFRVFMESVLWILFAIYIWQSVLGLFKQG